MIEEQYVTSARSNLVHYPNCKYVRIMKSPKMLTKGDIAGKLKYCKWCAPIMEYVTREKVRVERLCKRHQYYYYFDDDDGALDIISKGGRWKIMITNNSKNPILYHKNTSMISRGNAPIQGYHRQSIRCGSVGDYIKYIIDHDIYRNENPVYRSGKVKSKKTNKKNAERFRRNQSIRYVLDLIESVSEGKIAL